MLHIIGSRFRLPFLAVIGVPFRVPCRSIRITPPRLHRGLVFERKRIVVARDVASKRASGNARCRVKLPIAGASTPGEALRKKREKKRKRGIANRRNNAAYAEISHDISRRAVAAEDESQGGYSARVSRKSTGARPRL